MNGAPLASRLGSSRGRRAVTEERAKPRGALPALSEGPCGGFSKLDPLMASSRCFDVGVLADVQDALACPAHRGSADVRSEEQNPRADARARS